MLRPVQWSVPAMNTGACPVSPGNAVAESVEQFDADRCPFAAAEAAVAELGRETPVLLVDFHAEATSEKVALGWHLDGRVTAVAEGEVKVKELMQEASGAWVEREASLSISDEAEAKQAPQAKPKQEQKQ